MTKNLKNYWKKKSVLIILITIQIIFFFSVLNAGKKSFTIDDAMKFQVIKSSAISDNGRWVAYHTEPDRGNPVTYVKLSEEFENDKEYKIDMGTYPKFSNDSKWLAAIVKPKDIQLLNAEKDKKPKNNMTLLNLESGEKTEFENISRFVFSEDSKWMIYVIDKDKNKNDTDKKKDKVTGNDIVLRHLETTSELPIHDVTQFAFDSLGNYLVYVIAGTEGKRNGIYYIKLQGLFNFPQHILKAEKTHYSNLTWNDEFGILAFISAKEDIEGNPDSCSLMMWNSRQKELMTIINPLDTTDKELPEGWKIPFKNELKWTKDGNRLYFGLKPVADTSDKVIEVKYNDSNYYNIDSILAKRDLDLWHWNDTRIKTHEKIWWKENKDRIYRSVYHNDLKKFIFLADNDVSDVAFTDNPDFTIGTDDKPYLKEITWDGWFNDLYIVNLITGQKKKIATKIVENARISPKGNFIIWFADKNWYSYNTHTDSTVNLTANLPELPFYDREYDEPSDAPSYGFGGWLENDAAVLLYDEYDIWKFYLEGESYLNLTAAEGRFNKVIYRVLHLDPEKKFFYPREEVLISSYNWADKIKGLARINMSILGTEKVVLEDKRIEVLDKAKGTYKLLYVKQKYDMFPDLWVADSMFTYQIQVSKVHPELVEFNWGKTELLDWVSSKGDSLRGWIIKPDDFDPKKKYPMLVYFYDRFSNYYNQFFTPRVGHRPIYPVYTGKGYLIFHPDIVYTPGNPGYDATDCIVSGVRSLIGKGYVDSNAIGIQGHSWGGYQTAFIITQTNLFAAAVAGAPVGNMTSAYSGIRWGTGLARQFQYEKFQSRIGGNLWDSLDNYLNNSPIFQAQKIKTPFMLMFGDEDWAVPWEQGIELYLAMRRLNKNCIFLQYRGEPHWPEKYPNRLDYAIKMQEFFDHYILKTPAPEWLTKGIEYRGR
ncbi:MAG: prolyl oligopeptidase family serine peptidase [bacterium]